MLQIDFDIEKRQAKRDKTRYQQSITPPKKELRNEFLSAQDVMPVKKLAQRKISA